MCYFCRFRMEEKGQAQKGLFMPCGKVHPLEYVVQKRDMERNGIILTKRDKVFLVIMSCRKPFGRDKLEAVVKARVLVDIIAMPQGTKSNGDGVTLGKIVDLRAVLAWCLIKDRHSRFRPEQKVDIPLLLFDNLIRKVNMFVNGRILKFR